jgi:hypothetical protein
MPEWKPIPLSGFALNGDVQVLGTLENQILRHVLIYTFAQLRYCPLTHPRSVNSRYICWKSMKVEFQHLLRYRLLASVLLLSSVWRLQTVAQFELQINFLTDSRRGLGIFFFTTAFRTALGPTQPPIQCVSGALSLRVKRLGREADHSPPSSAEVKEWVELYFHSASTPSGRGAQLMQKETFTILLQNLLQ